MRFTPSAPTQRSRAVRWLRFAQALARWGVPRRSLLFGPLSLGDDLLCTTVLHEARKRGAPFTMMTARPELFRGNVDPTTVIPIDNDYVAGLRRLGATVVQPYYVRATPAEPQRDVLPGRHILAEMCALAGLRGGIALRPYLRLTAEEQAGGRHFPRQIALHSTGLGAAIPYAAKEWGAARFSAVARLLAPHARLVQLGASADPALPVDLDLRGRTTLREAAAVLAASAVFVGLEGFLAHLARAVDCPATIVFGGRARPEIFGYAGNANLYSEIECGPCGLREGCPHEMACMAQIAPADVAAAALDLMARGRPMPVGTAHLP